MAQPDQEGLQQLLELYDSMGGQAPEGAPPELQEFFRSIDESKKEAARVQQQQQEGERQEIYPKPEFVVKTVDDAGRKVFVNVCSSDSVAEPESWHDGVMPDKVKAAFDNLEGVTEEQAEAMRIPLSLSERRNDFDKHGEPCTVFDCVFATTICSQAALLRPLKVFMIETVLGWIDHKHSLGLDPRFKLPKLKYKGDTICSHWIRKDPKKLVTEISEVEEPSSEDPSVPLRARPIPAEKRERLNSAKQAGSSGAAVASMETPSGHAAATGAPGCAQTSDTKEEAGQKDDAEAAQIEGIEYVGQPCRSVIVTIRLPGTDTWREGDVTVRASVASLHVGLKGRAPMAVGLNIYIRVGSVQCSVKGYTLTIRAEYYPAKELLREMAANKPLPPGALALQSSSLLDELD